jgi:putative phage-type endonuclease
MNTYKGTHAVIVADIDPERFAEQRRDGIVGTDISAIAGINPWKSALTVYHEKTTGETDNAESERMFWGKRLESVIAEETAEREGLTIQEVPHILAHPENQYCRAQIDRLIIDPERGNGVLEVKNMGHWSSQRVRIESGEESIPDHYLLQIQWQLYVTGLQWGKFSALMEGSELRTVEVKRDDELIAGLASIAQDFWKCVKDKTPPAADGSESTSETLKKMFPVPEAGKVVNLGSELEGLFIERLTLAEQIKPLEARKKEVENLIKLAIGDAETATCGFYTATLKLVEKAEYTVKASSYRMLKIK